jgi:hypothetical protein
MFNPIFMRFPILRENRKYSNLVNQHFVEKRGVMQSAKRRRGGSLSLPPNEAVPIAACGSLWDNASPETDYQCPICPIGFGRIASSGAVIRIAAEGVQVAS